MKLFDELDWIKAANYGHSGRPGQRGGSSPGKGSWSDPINEVNRGYGEQFQQNRAKQVGFHSELDSALNRFGFKPVGNVGFYERPMAGTMKGQYQHPRFGKVTTREDGSWTHWSGPNQPNIAKGQGAADLQSHLSKFQQATEPRYEREAGMGRKRELWREKGYDQ